jgi:hypothetical protein
MMGGALLLSLSTIVSASVERPKDAQGVHDGIATGCAFGANSTHINKKDHCRKCVEDAVAPKNEKLIKYMYDKCLDESSSKGEK